MVDRCHPSSSQPELDLTIIEGIHELGGAELVHELIHLSYDDIDQRLAALERALGHGDARAVRQMAHAISGSSANIGAIRVAETTADLEQLAAAGTLDGAAPLVAELAHRWRGARLALDQQLRLTAVLADPMGAVPDLAASAGAAWNDPSGSS